MKILNLREQPTEEKFRWLYAWDMFNTFTVTSVIVLIIGVLTSSSVLFSGSILLFGCGIGLSLYIYKTNKPIEEDETEEEATKPEKKEVEQTEPPTEERPKLL